MKICISCSFSKELTEFYNSSKKCKECTKIAARANYIKNIDKYKAYDRARSNDPKRLELRAKYLKTEAGKESKRKTIKAYVTRNPKKRKAHNLVNNAVRDGKLIKPEHCEKCSSTKIIAHHDDYNKPLEVRWLCSKDHRKWHDENGEGLNAN